MIQQDPFRDHLPPQEREDPEIDEQSFGGYKRRPAVGLPNGHIIKRHTDVREYFDLDLPQIHFPSELGFGLPDQQGFVIGAVQEERKGEDDGGDGGEGNEDQPRELSAEIPHGADNTVHGPKCQRVDAALREATGRIGYNPPTVPPSIAEQPPPSSPSRIRWKILALLTLISIITYVDRVNISVTARQMMPAMGLTQVQMGYVFSAFVLGYALFQVPGGWLGDRWGSRLVLTGAVVWWSVFTILTAVAGTLPTVHWVGVLGSLILVRFLIGVGEAAALPNFNRTVADWLPPMERGLGMGVSIGGIGIGSAITFPLVAWMMVNYGWQSAFYASGLAGLAVALLWGWYATDRPEQHHRVNQGELHYIRESSLTPALPPAEPVPWRAFARTPAVWWLVLSYTGLGYVAYVYMNWFYLYLVEERGYEVLRGGLFASGPFLAMTVLCPLGGWVTDRLVGSLGVNRGRSYVGFTGMVLSGTCIVAGSQVAAPYAAIVLLSLGAGFLYFTVGAFWAGTIDLAPRHAGTLSGMMNTGANLGGTISPTLTPWLAEHFGWTVSLGVAAGIAWLGGLLWLWVRTGDGLRMEKNGP
jgi:ACS family glucarate transporter-like MFS transporter